jgi:protein phosphatase
MVGRAIRAACIIIGECGRDRVHVIMKELQSEVVRAGAPASTEAGAAAADSRDALRAAGIIPADDAPPFDIVGDVHGCHEELCRLLKRLGYAPEGEGFRPPEGRRLVFVGDLADRGPLNLPVLRAVLAMRDADTALTVLGNHDLKLLRWLRGEHVRMSYGLALTVSEILAVPEPEQVALRGRLTALLETTPGYLILDGGRLVVTHGGIRDDMIGRWDDTVRAYCLYGEVEGTSHRGKPLRRDWGALRELRFGAGDDSPAIVYGHNPVRAARWQHRTLDLDTGCVYGGQLSALRYPELEVVQVSADRSYFCR